MKRTVFVWSLVIALGLGAVIGFSYFQNVQSAKEQNATEAKKEAPEVASNKLDARQEASKQPGVYEEYQEGLVASTDGVKLLFFHAPWCPQCRMIEEDIKSNGVPDGVVILKVDYDSNQALRQKYEITLQTTFVKIDDKGKAIKKYVAYNEPNFDSVKQNLLSE